MRRRAMTEETKPKAAGELPKRLERFDVTAESGVTLLGVKVNDIPISLNPSGGKWSGHRTIAFQGNVVAVTVEAESKVGDALLDLTVQAGEKKLSVRRTVSGKFSKTYQMDP
jgi:hypothetical protein